jgi:hypothetical protein
MKHRHKGQQIPLDQLQRIAHNALNEVLENGGIFSLEVLHLTHEVRIMMDVTERYCSTGSLTECKSIVIPMFQADPQNPVPERKAQR